MANRNVFHFSSKAQQLDTLAQAQVMDWEFLEGLAIIEHILTDYIAKTCKISQSELVKFFGELPTLLI